MKHFIILFFSIHLFSCHSNQKQSVEQQQQCEIVLPKDAVPIQYDGNDAILYDFWLNDSTKIKTISLLVYISTLRKFGYKSTRYIGIKIETKPFMTIFVMSSAFNQPPFNTYWTMVDRDRYPLLSNLLSYRMSRVLAVNMCNITHECDSVKGLLPIKSFAKNGILNMNLKKKYLLSLDSVSGEGYTKIPFTTIKNVPIINTRISFSKNNEICSLEGNFMVDLGFVNFIGIKAETAKSRPLTCESANSSILENLGDTVDVQLEGIITQNIPVYKSAITVDDFVGVLGLHFLARFDVIFDYKNELLYLKEL